MSKLETDFSVENTVHTTLENTSASNIEERHPNQTAPKLINYFPADKIRYDDPGLTDDGKKFVKQDRSHISENNGCYPGPSKFAQAIPQKLYR